MLIWALKVWQTWRAERICGGQEIPEFTDIDAASLDFWMQRFIVEVRTQKGAE